MVGCGRLLLLVLGLMGVPTLLMAGWNSADTTPLPLLPTSTDAESYVSPVPSETPSPLPTIPVTPTPPIMAEVRYQSFEYGFMLQNLDYDCVYAFSTQTNNIIIPAAIADQVGGTYRYCLPITGSPIMETAPSGSMLPEGVFGQVWSAYPEVRSGLGYATQPEVIYESRIPPSDPVMMGGIFYAGVLSLPDGGQLYCGQRAATAGDCHLR